MSGISVSIYSTVDETPDNLPFVSQIRFEGKWHPVVFRAETRMLAYTAAKNWWQGELDKEQARQDRLARGRATQAAQYEERQSKAGKKSKAAVSEVKP